MNFICVQFTFNVHDCMLTFAYGESYKVRAIITRGCVVPWGVSRSICHRLLHLRRFHSSGQRSMWWLHALVGTGSKRNNFAWKWKRIVWILVIVMLLAVFLHHAHTEYRCASEILSIENSPIIFTENKTGAYVVCVTQCIRVYVIGILDQPILSSTSLD